MHKILSNRGSYLQLLGALLMLSQPGSARQAYYVLVSEWGVKTLVTVHATSVQSAEEIARRNAQKKDGWEGIRNVYNAFPMVGKES